MKFSIFLFILIFSVSLSTTDYEEASFIDGQVIDLQNFEIMSEIYYDYLTSLGQIETTGSRSIGNPNITWDVKELYYYIDDFNYDGISDLAVSAEERDSCGIVIFTYRNGLIEELFSYGMPYSAGTEILTLAKYRDRYGILSYRDNSTRPFTFRNINPDGTVEAILRGNCFGSEFEYTDDYNLFCEIEPVVFYNIEKLEN